MSRKHKKTDDEKLLMSLTRTCPKCGFTGNGTHFGWRVKRREWLNTYCRECQREASRKYRQRPGYYEKYREYQRNYLATKKGRKIQRKGHKAYYNRNKEKI